MIRLDIPTVCLLPHLPDDFSIGQADAVNVVTISLQGQDIYTTTLYGKNGECRFYELRTLIHDNMRQRQLALAKLKITVAMEGGAEVLDGHYILFSSTFTPYEDDEEFFEKCFLTTRTYYTYPRSNGGVTLSFLMMPGQKESVVLNCVFRREDGSTCSAQLQGAEYSAPATEPALKQYTVSLANIDFMARSSLGEDCGTLIAFTVIIGKRAMPIYITDEKPSEVFSFRNIFNVYETARIYGTKTIKTEFSAKEARCGGRNLKYDQSRTQVFQIETRALPIEEAEWLTQMFESPYVAYTPSFYDSERVVFSDVTSEISNSAKDQVRLKFSYKYESNMMWMEPRSEGNRFTFQYNETFD